MKQKSKIFYLFNIFIYYVSILLIYLLLSYLIQKFCKNTLILSMIGLLFILTYFLICFNNKNYLWFCFKYIILLLYIIIISFLYFFHSFICIFYAQLFSCIYISCIEIFVNVDYFIARINQSLDKLSIDHSNNQRCSCSSSIIIVVIHTKINGM